MNTFEAVRTLNQAKALTADLTQLNKQVLGPIDTDDIAQALGYINLLRARLQDVLDSRGYVSPRKRKLAVSRGLKELARVCN